MSQARSVVSWGVAGVALLAAILTALPARAAESRYTNLDLDACLPLGEAQQEGVTLHCAGFGGYGVLFMEGDLRHAVLFGHVGDWFAEGAFESFDPFNHVNDTIEWRIDEEGRPYAAILRWFIENIDPDTGAPSEAHRGQVLVVSRVGQPGDAHGCVIAYVDALANPDANEIARDLADNSAKGYACGTANPFYHGKRGALSADPSRYYPSAPQ